MFSNAVFPNNTNSKQKNITKGYVFLFVFFYFVVFFFINTVLAGESEEQTRSSSLKIVTTEEKDTERIDYINEEGEITYAADKHYATIIRTKKDHSVLEEYFDASGQPSEQTKGYYAINKEYNAKGQNYKNTYLGINGKPIIISDGYSCIIRTFNEEGYIETEMFYDTEGNPIETPLRAYGTFKEYNENGRNIRITYLDMNKEPIMCGLGFAILYRTYYESGKNIGKIRDEFYFDLNNEPICLSLGQFGLHREYDEFGREICFTYLDADGSPVMTKDGYATIKRTYYDDDSLKMKQYYDEKGNPIELPGGYYGFRIENGETIYIDSEGNDLFNLKHFLYTHQYCVIIACLALVIVASVANKKVNAIFLVCYLVFIIYMTLLYRNGESDRANLILFWSYRQFFVNQNLRWEILYNIFLFIPMGAILYRIYPQNLVLLAPIFLSFIIESVQFITGVGLFEFDDLFSNCIGTLIGFFGCFVITSCFLKRKIINETK